MTTLISERLPYFHRVALRRLNNVADAEDAVQDAFLSAWKHLDKFKGDAQMSTWLTVIVTNSARMVLRRRPRSLHLPIEATDHDANAPHFSEILPDGNPDPETEVRRRELSHRLASLSAHLSPRLQEIVRMRGVEGLSIRQTGDALGLTDRAVKTRAARARQELKRLHECNPVQVPAPKLRRQRPRRRIRQDQRNVE
jgi:RNA polymerase sigma-70 factor (ECF subfamily)